MAAQQPQNQYRNTYKIVARKPELTQLQKLIQSIACKINDDGSNEIKSSKWSDYFIKKSNNPREFLLLLREKKLDKTRDEFLKEFKDDIGQLQQDNLLKDESKNVGRVLKNKYQYTHIAERLFKYNKGKKSVSKNPEPNVNSFLFSLNIGNPNPELNTILEIIQDNSFFIPVYKFNLSQKGINFRIQFIEKWIELLTIYKSPKDFAEKVFTLPDGTQKLGSAITDKYRYKSLYCELGLVVKMIKQIISKYCEIIGQARKIEYLKKCPDNETNRKKIDILGEDMIRSYRKYIITSWYSLHKWSSYLQKQMFPTASNDKGCFLLSLFLYYIEDRFMKIREKRKVKKQRIDLTSKNHPGDYSNNNNNNNNAQNINPTTPTSLSTLKTQDKLGEEYADFLSVKHLLGFNELYLYLTKLYPKKVKASPPIFYTHCPKSSTVLESWLYYILKKNSDEDIEHLFKMLGYDGTKITIWETYPKKRFQFYPNTKSKSKLHNPLITVSFYDCIEKVSVDERINKRRYLEGTPSDKRKILNIIKENTLNPEQPEGPIEIPGGNDVPENENSEDDEPGGPIIDFESDDDNPEGPSKPSGRETPVNVQLKNSSDKKIQSQANLAFKALRKKKDRVDPQTTLKQFFQWEDDHPDLYEGYVISPDFARRGSNSKVVKLLRNRILNNQPFHPGESKKDLEYNNLLHYVMWRTARPNIKLFKGQKIPDISDLVSEAKIIQLITTNQYYGDFIAVNDSDFENEELLNIVESLLSETDKNNNNN